MKFYIKPTEDNTINFIANAVIYFRVTPSYNYCIIDNRNETTAKRGIPHESEAENHDHPPDE